MTETNENDWQVSNQMVISCKAFIARGDGDIWTQPLPIVEATFNECLQLHTEYREQFQTLRRQLSDKPEFSEVIMFSKFDKFADRLRKIIEIGTIMQTYRGLRDSKIEGGRTCSLNTPSCFVYNL